MNYLLQITDKLFSFLKKDMTNTYCTSTKEKLQYPVRVISEEVISFSCKWPKLLFLLNLHLFSSFFFNRALDPKTQASKDSGFQRFKDFTKYRHFQNQDFSHVLTDVLVLYWVNNHLN